MVEIPDGRAGIAGEDIVEASEQSKQRAGTGMLVRARDSARPGQFPSPLRRQLKWRSKVNNPTVRLKLTVFASTTAHASPLNQKSELHLIPNIPT